MSLKYSQANPAAPLDGSELIGLTQNGADVRSTTGAIAGLGGGSVGEGFATRALMAGRLAPIVLDDVYLKEPGREGKFIVDLAANWTAEIAADTQQGLFVLSTADVTKVYRRIVDGPYRVEWWGAPANGVDDDYAKTIACFAAVTAGGGGYIQCYPKDYISTGTLTWDNSIILFEGSGGNLQSANGTRWHFPNSATQIGCINPKNGSAGRGSGSGCRNITIVGAGGAPVSSANAKLGYGSGLLAQCAGTHINVTAMNCEGKGIYGLSASAVPDISINCNGAVFINCVAYQCGSDGRGLFGVDSNSITFLGGGSLQCQGFGDHLNGLEGSRVIAPNYEGNVAGLVRFGDITSHNTIEGATFEGPSYLVQLDLGGGGYNYVEFATPAGAITWTDNSVTGTNDYTWQGVRKSMRLGGDGANGTTVITDGLLLMRMGALFQSQDNPLTANWLHGNVGGKYLFLLGGVAYLAITNAGPDTAGVYKVAGTQVLGARQAGDPGAATDPTTTMALANWLRTIILAHGIGGT